MNDKLSIPLAPIRLLFELERADNPRLYDDLTGFKKGTKRVNRLRTLAHEGLLAQHWSIGLAAHVSPARSELGPQDRGDALRTTHIFDEPLTE